MLEVKQVSKSSESAIGAIVHVPYGRTCGQDGKVGVGRVVEEKRRWGRNWVKVQNIEGLPFDDMWYDGEEIISYDWSQQFEKAIA